MHVSGGERRTRQTAGVAGQAPVALVDDAVGFFDLGGKWREVRHVARVNRVEEDHRPEQPEVERKEEGVCNEEKES